MKEENDDLKEILSNLENSKKNNYISQSNMKKSASVLKKSKEKEKENNPTMVINTTSTYFQDESEDNVKKKNLYNQAICSRNDIKRKASTQVNSTNPLKIINATLCNYLNNKLTNSTKSVTLSKEQRSKSHSKFIYYKYLGPKIDTLNIYNIINKCNCRVLSLMTIEYTKEIQ